MTAPEQTHPTASVEVARDVDVLALRTEALARVVAERDAARAEVADVVRARNYAMNQRDEERRAKSGNIAALNAAIIRAEAAEAEVVTLRARLAEGRRIVGMLAETVESECEDDPEMCHEHDRTDDGRCPLLVDLNRAHAALATTGEGE